MQQGPGVFANVSYYLYRNEEKNKKTSGFEINASPLANGLPKIMTGPVKVSSSSSVWLYHVWLDHPVKSWLLDDMYYWFSLGYIYIYSECSCLFHKQLWLVSLYTAVIVCCHIIFLYSFVCTVKPYTCMYFMLLLLLFFIGIILSHCFHHEPLLCCYKIGSKFLAYKDTNKANYKGTLA